MFLCKPAKKISGSDDWWKCAECGSMWPDQTNAELCCAKAVTSAASNQYQIGGDHYQGKAVQPWDAMEAWMSRDQFIGFLRGNAIKYLARAGSKGDAVIDYRKAQHYLTKLIETLDAD
jgi:hypothetical protein